MKKIIYTLIAVMMATFSINAQNIVEKESSMSLGSQNGFYVDIEEADKDITIKVFKKFMKDYGKVKRNKKAKEYYSESIKIPVVNGADNVAFYAKFDERVDLTTVYAWVDLGGEFVNSNESTKAALGMESFLGDLYVAVRKKVIENEMKDAEKQMKKLEKGMRKLEKKNTNYHEDIEDAKKAIVEAEKNIEQNLRDQDDQKVLMAKQKEMIEAIVAKLNAVGKE